MKPEDNFLESHYEEYLRKKAIWEKNKKKKKMGVKRPLSNRRTPSACTREVPVRPDDEAL